MLLLEEKIKREGIILPGDVLKVDAFINHQIDVALMDKLAGEFYRLFRDDGVNKILTIESSGIGAACLTARYFGVNVVFAKKSKSSNMSGDAYHALIPSYTHANVNDVIVSKPYLGSSDRVLIIDDFLATGNALLGLIDICHQAGAEVVGCGILVEKSYQSGGDAVRRICRVESLARIASMSEQGDIHFIHS